MNGNVLVAIFKRNFFAYFSNPTGYVFICVFVVLTSFAAFWPDAFFAKNLANFDQLNTYLPWILLVFIPAITMGVWAEERRQGTDELLLTIPAHDLDVVLGKYLAAVAIYTVSLGFSLSNLVILNMLGAPDWGLMFGNYVGFWLVGLAMLAVGMVASFFTSNLTIAFILGLAFNAPLVFADYAGVILPYKYSQVVRTFSIPAQFGDFGNGVITLTGVIYFGSLTVIMLYLSVVLIGKRHWFAGMGQHYVLRFASLLVTAIGLNLVAAGWLGAARWDTSAEQLSSLSPNTTELLANLDPKRPIAIDAFISPEVPTRYVETRQNLLAMLREVDRRGGNDVILRIRDTIPFSQEALDAEEQFGITGRPIASMDRGSQRAETIFLGVAVTSGLEKVVIPFFDRGIPVEYEIVRSIATVSQAKRKKLGVVRTDAQLFGRLDFQTFRQTPDQRLVDELQKQYEVTEVDPSSPIDADDYDALLVVQPSTLGPEQLPNLVNAIRSGVPTAVFEDPFPFPSFQWGCDGTSEPRRQPGGRMASMFGGGGPPPPKGRIDQLWDLLGVTFPPQSIVWQKFNPHPQLQEFPPEFVFAARQMPERQGSDSLIDAFNEEDEITSGLQELLFLFPGEVHVRHGSKLEYTPLVNTSKATGTVTTTDMRQRDPMRPMSRLRDAREFHLAVEIKGEPAAAPAGLPGLPGAAPGGLPFNHPLQGDDPANKNEVQPGDEIDTPAEGSGDKKSAKKETKSKSAKSEPKRKKREGIHVVLVADIDFLHSQFFGLREAGNDPDVPVLNMDLDNVTFALNIIDRLAGEERFIDIRKRRRQHRTLVEFDKEAQKERERIDKAQAKAEAEIKKAQKEGQKRLDDKVAKIREEMKDSPNPERMLQQLQQVQKVEQQRLDNRINELVRDHERRVKRIETEADLAVRKMQFENKMYAVIFPPIPPLLFGVGLLFFRRAQESEGVSKRRLR